jgi:hypothetical protein
MNTKNNLHNALNKAFENHVEPLNEAQWTRLEGAIIQKKKRRFFPFFLLFLAISFTAGITYFLTLNYGLTTTQTGLVHSRIDKNNNTQSNLDYTNAIIENNLPNSENSDLSIVKTHSIAKSGILKTTIKPAKSGKSFMPAEKDESNELAYETETTKVYGDDKPAKKDKFEELLVAEIKIDIEKVEILKEKDTLYPSLTTHLDDNKNIKPAPKFAFSFSGGYSKLNVKVSNIENAEKLHKDTRQIFEASNQNLKTDFYSLGMDWDILPKYRIGFNTGIQYLRTAAPINMNYLLTEVPFWDNKRTQIEGYLTKDSSDALRFNTTSTNYNTYISVPVRFYYAIPLNSKNEILIATGANLSLLASAKGKSIVINNEPGVKPLDKSMYRQFNAGFISGLQYNTKLKDSWWIGVESLWQTNPMKYKTGDGSIKNKMQGYSFNAVIKYKI